LKQVSRQSRALPWPRFAGRGEVRGGERFYTDAYNFEPIAAARAREKADQDEYWFSNRYTFEWKQFCEQVQSSSRFFGIKERLDAFFGKPEEYGEGPVRPVYELPPSRVIFRARLMDGDLTERRSKLMVRRFWARRPLPVLRAVG
jgi:hypothetical protein